MGDEDGLPCSLNFYITNSKYNPYPSKVRDGIWYFIHHEVITSGYAQLLRVFVVPFEDKIVINVSYKWNDGIIKFTIDWENKFSSDEFEDQLRAYHMLLKEDLTTS